jgi:hypothetical protein
MACYMLPEMLWVKFDRKPHPVTVAITEQMAEI